MPRFITSLLAGSVMAVLFIVVAPRPAAAIDLFPDQNPDGTSAVCGTAKDAAACSGSNTISGSNGIILRAAGLLAIIASISAVVVIMTAGIMFVTAAGDSNKISNAKKMITYAVVGLVVIFLARTIVVFLINNV